MAERKQRLFNLIEDGQPASPPREASDADSPAADSPSADSPPANSPPPNSPPPNSLAAESPEVVETAPPPREAKRGRRAPSRKTGVGGILAAERMRKGADLADIATSLRIRLPYLQAIEDERYADLPGAAYAVGFVRAYGRYLGLDEESLVQRFKEEADEIGRRSELVFPSPIREGRIPGVSVMAVAAVLAVAAYGGWYIISADGGRGDAVPEIPERLAHLANSGSAPDSVAAPPAAKADAAGAGKREDAPQSKISPVAKLPAASAPAATPPAKLPRAQSAPAESPTIQSTQAESIGVKPIGSESSGPAPRAAQGDADGTSAPEKAVAPAAQPAASPPAPQASRDAADEIPTAPETAAAIDGKPRLFGEGNRDSRITLVATRGSWVQIRAGDDRLLLTRILRAGDRYRVPNRPGLTLNTGNAGALEILVDGAPVPMIGAAGDVRRNVMMDPDLLLRGLAASE